jgi:regulatory protein YycI of two-component signal transduction system YycFG
MKWDKKSVIFLIVFLLLVISILYRVKHPFIQKRMDRLTYTSKHPADKSMAEKRIGTAELVEEGSVASKFLNKPRISGKVFKDLFPISLPSRKTEEKIDIQTLPAKVSVQNDLLSEAKAYLASYKIEGTYESENVKAVFLSKEKLVLVLKAGDRLDGKYLIEDIQKDRVRIKALDLNETINLDLGELNNE